MQNHTDLRARVDKSIPKKTGKELLVTPVRRHRKKSREIVSGSSAPFFDRKEAGRLLGLQLLKYQCLNPVVVGIPRGGMVVAGEVARVLFTDLDFTSVCRIHSPEDEDTSLAAMTENGCCLLNEAAIQEAGSRDLTKEKLCLKADMAYRCRKYRAVRPKVPVWHRVVILVDDGATSGVTMHAAIQAVRSEHPRAILVALPVGSKHVLDSIAGDSDGLVCLRSPEIFSTARNCYINYQPVTDNDVVKILSWQPKNPVMDPHMVCMDLY